MRFRVLSVEWGKFTAHKSNIPPILTHCVFPDLDEKIIPKSQRDSFFDIIPTQCQIQTVAVNNCPTNDWLRYVSDRITEGKTRRTDPAKIHLLIVGGNKKSRLSTNLFSTEEAIRSCTSCFRDRIVVWAVTDLNDPDCMDGLLRKLDAGATGIITQPLLSKQAFDSLMRFSEITYDSATNLTFVAGMALPKTVRGLRFWASLLRTSLDGDPIFQDHCKYFEEKGSDCHWALTQIKALKAFEMVHGVHFMPMSNNLTLEMLLDVID